MLCQQINTKPCSSAAGHAPRSTLNHSNSQAFAPSPQKESSAAPDSSVTRWSWRLLPLPAAFSSRRSRSLELLCLNAEHRARFRASNSSSEEKRSLSEQTWVSGGGLCRKQPGAHLPLLLPHHVFVFILPVGIFQLLLPLGIGCRLRLGLPRAGSGRFGVFTLELLGHPSRCSAGREGNKERGSEPRTGPWAHSNAWKGCKTPAVITSRGEEGPSDPTGGAEPPPPPIFGSSTGSEPWRCPPWSCGAEDEQSQALHPRMYHGRGLWSPGRVYTATQPLLRQV